MPIVIVKKVDLLLNKSPLAQSDKNDSGRSFAVSSAPLRPRPPPQSTAHTRARVGSPEQRASLRPDLQPRMTTIDWARNCPDAGSPARH